MVKCCASDRDFWVSTHLLPKGSEQRRACTSAAAIPSPKHTPHIHSFTLYYWLHTLGDSGHLGVAANGTVDAKNAWGRAGRQGRLPVIKSHNP